MDFPAASGQEAAHPKANRGKKRLEAIAVHAVRFRDRLTSDPLAASGDDQLLEEVRDHIRTLHTLSQRSSSSAEDAKLDHVGTTLWNLCTRLKRSNGDRVQTPSDTNAGLFLLGRVFALYLLDASSCCAEERIYPDVIRLMRLSLKAGRSCIECSEYELAALVFQKAADHNSRLRDLRPGLPRDEERDAHGLETEFFILRTVLAWKENRMDVAEHMFQSGKLVPGSMDPYRVENLADILYEMGKDMSAKADFTMAVKWLDRAKEAIDSPALELLSREGSELRAAIAQALVAALFGLRTAHGFERAESIINMMETEAGNTLVVSLLRLELLQEAPAEVFDGDSYADVLRRMIRSFRHTESNFNLLAHHIRKLHDKSPGLGCNVLDAFIVAIRSAETDAWLEKLVVIRIWMATSQRDSPDTAESALGILERLDRPLGADATVAAQMLLWKRLESSYALGQFDLASKWCQVALHRVFRSSGPGNIAKLERFLLCSIARNDMDGARAVFYSMAEETQKEAKTAYLMYKVATRSGDHCMATQCLEDISRATEQQQEYLYACVVDSQQAGEKVCAIRALRKLIEKYEFTSSTPIRLPALLRCTIRLLKSVLDDDSGVYGESDGVQHLCSLFDAAVDGLEREPRDVDGNKLFDFEELDWFARNSYNLVLRNLGKWELRHCIQMLTACTRIIGRFPPDVSSQVAQDVSLKLLFCNFIIASALVAEARTRDSNEAQLQDYLSMRVHIAAFEDGLPARVDSTEGKARDDLLNKLATLLAFDLEGAIRLKKWEALCEIIRKAARCRSATTLQSMGDCLLRCGVPAQELHAGMRIIINEIWALEDFRVGKLAKHMRCLFQATLPLDDKLALGLMDEFCEWTREASSVGLTSWLSSPIPDAVVFSQVENPLTSPSQTTNPMPNEELEWLATTAFNHAVDYYMKRQDEQSKQWASRALNLAHYCDDQGAFEGVLHEKHLSLRFDVE